MSTVEQRLLTAEEFQQLPDPPGGVRQELVRGVIVTMPPPGGQHGVCCSRIGRRLAAFVEDGDLGFVASNDTGFISERDPDTVRGPDLSYWSRQRLPAVPEGYVTVPPDLAVEVVSPNDRFGAVQAKVKHYLERGVRLVWVADPQDRSVTVFRPGRPADILEENEMLTGADVLPGFGCRVGELFA